MIRTSSSSSYIFLPSIVVVDVVVDSNASHYYQRLSSRLSRHTFELRHRLLLLYIMADVCADLEFVWLSSGFLLARVVVVVVVVEVETTTLNIIACITVIRQ